MLVSEGLSNLPSQRLATNSSTVKDEFVLDASTDSTE